MRKERKGKGWEQSSDCESSIRSRVRRKTVLCGVQGAASSSQSSSTTLVTSHAKEVARWAFCEKVA